MASVMPPGYRFDHDPNEVARLVLSKSTWAVLALTCHIELFTQEHYKRSISPDPELSDLFKDVFLFHWKEESQHAVLDELEWSAEDERLSDEQRDRAVDDFLALVGAVDGLVQAQAKADVRYFANTVGRLLRENEIGRVEATILAAYRYQYIGSGAGLTRFVDALFAKLNEAQRARVRAAVTSYVL